MKRTINGIKLSRADYIYQLVVAGVIILTAVGGVVAIVAFGLAVLGGKL